MQLPLHPPILHHPRQKMKDKIVQTVFGRSPKKKKKNDAAFVRSIMHASNILLPHWLARHRLVPSISLSLFFHLNASGQRCTLMHFMPRASVPVSTLRTHTGKNHKLRGKTSAGTFPKPVLVLNLIQGLGVDFKPTRVWN